MLYMICISQKQIKVYTGGQCEKRHEILNHYKEHTYCYKNHRLNDTTL